MHHTFITHMSSNQCEVIHLGNSYSLIPLCTQVHTSVSKQSIPASQPEGRRFKSCPRYQYSPLKPDAQADPMHGPSDYKPTGPLHEISIDIAAAARLIKSQSVPTTQGRHPPQSLSISLAVTQQDLDCSQNFGSSICVTHLLNSWSLSFKPAP